MSLLIIPAIDLKDGKCVRLRQGKMDQATVFSDDPVATAGRWVKAGARRLHVVDLNGAHAGKPVNAPAIQAIVKAFPELPVDRDSAEERLLLHERQDLIERLKFFLMDVRPRAHARIVRSPHVDRARRHL